MTMSSKAFQWFKMDRARFEAVARFFTFDEAKDECPSRPLRIDPVPIPTARVPFSAHGRCAHNANVGSRRSRMLGTLGANKPEYREGD